MQKQQIKEKLQAHRRERLEAWKRIEKLEKAIIKAHKEKKVQKQEEEKS